MGSHKASNKITRVITLADLPAVDPGPLPEDAVAIIRPWEFHDRLTGNRVAIRVSPYYSILEINDRIYYFRRETGGFDGTSCPMG